MFHRFAVLLFLPALLAFASSAARGEEREARAHERTAPSEGPKSPPAARWWSFEPLKKEAPPESDAKGWGRNAIDSFLLARLRAENVDPPPEADKRTLARRAYFDLIGLPPRPEEVDAFLEDLSPDAYEKLIDRLLASPHYGERWGRYWLDAVRYADSNGYERDGEKKHAWKYRDYVIRSLNEDKPFDRFIKEQIAGDEIEVVTPETRIATGFHRLGPWDDEPADPVQDRYDQLDDMLRTTGRVFLGLTIDCARCHDHKFDPIPQSDYYRLLSFFLPSRPENDFALISDAEKAAYDEAVRRIEGEMKSLEKMVGEMEAPVRRILSAEKEAALPQEKRALLSREAGSLTQEEKKAVEALKKSLEPTAEEVIKRLGEGERSMRESCFKRIEELKASRPKPYDVALGLTDAGKDAPPTKVLVRGDAHQPGEEVEPGFLSCVSLEKPVIPDLGPWRQTTGRRRALASWIVSPENPLTARVIANRIWLFHFGNGLVATPNDFGKMGEKPTQPELLDWLSLELMRNGWRWKPLHRLIMTSSAYRSSSGWRQLPGEKDPEDKLLWRFPMRRLDAEAVRDAILFATGRLNLQMGGEPVFPEVEKEVLAGQSRPGDGWRASSEEAASRRSVYVFVKRSVILPFLQVMDFADTGQSCARRNVSTTALQSLTFLNSKFMNREAEHFARRLLEDSKDPPASVPRWRKHIERAYRLALSRPSSEEELSAMEEYLERQRARLEGKEGALGGSQAAVRTLESLALVMFNLNEFVYID